MHLIVIGSAIITLCLAATAPAATFRPLHAPLLLYPIALEPAVNSDLFARVEVPAGTPGKMATDLEDMKAAYLRCEREALRGALSGEDAMVCSVIYEELKRAAFAGDAGRLREWSAPLLGFPRLMDQGDG